MTKRSAHPSLSISPTATPCPYPRAIAPMPEWTGHIMEGAVAHGFGTSDRRGRTTGDLRRGKRSTLYEVNVEPTVVVEVEQPHASTGRHRWYQPPRGATVFLDEIEPHRLGVVTEPG